jgi:protein-disulfide isomerase
MKQTPYFKRGYALATGSILLLTLSVAQGSAAEPCAAITDSVKKDLGAYLRTKYRLPAATEVALIESSPVGDTCYEKLRFEAGGKQTPIPVYYLSPDRKFLAADLLDLRADPLEAEKKAEREAAQKLSQSAATYLGSEQAPVTVVVFSDFECPFCRKAAEILRAEMESPEGKNVRLVFRHFPLAMHPWARKAAEAAACVNLQSRESFWQLHDFIFHNQQTFNVDNIDAKLLDFVRAAPGLNAATYQNCLDDALSVGMVIRDTSLGTANRVTGTPTVFVNGRRLQQGVRDSSDLRAAIAEAMGKTPAQPIARAGSGETAVSCPRKH